MIAQQLGAPRFEAEGLAYLAEIDRLTGRASDATAKVEVALAISRKSGMAYMGPIILATAALAADVMGVVDAYWMRRIG